MQLPQAFTLLEVSAQASASERMQAFESKRDKLEGQVAQSPTPALKEKFRAKLKELEQAYALIEKELASDELPVAAPVNVCNNQAQGGFQQSSGHQSNDQESSDFAAEHHWKLQIMEELDERFGKTLNSSQLQGYLASCAPQQNLDTLIPLALDKIKKYGKEPLDSEYYKQAKWLQNTLFTLFVANRKDHSAFRELLHQETISGIEALALLCAEKKHFVTPIQQEALQLKRQKIKRAFPKAVALSVFVISGVIAQPYISEYVDNRNNVLEIVDGALESIQRKNFDEASSQLNNATSKKVLFTEGVINEAKLKLYETHAYHLLNVGSIRVAFNQFGKIKSIKTIGKSKYQKAASSYGNKLISMTKVKVKRDDVEVVETILKQIKALGIYSPQVIKKVQQDLIDFLNISIPKSVGEQNIYRVEKQLELAEKLGMPTSKIDEFKGKLDQVKQNVTIKKVRFLIERSKSAYEDFRFGVAEARLSDAKAHGVLLKEINTIEKAFRLAVQTANNRYQIIENGSVVEDNKTNLQWMRCSIGQSYVSGGCSGKAIYNTYSQAQDLVKNYDYSGWQDWRLPSQQELQSLVFCSTNGHSRGYFNDSKYSLCDSDVGLPTIYSFAFPNTPSEFYWTLSPKRAGNTDWYSNLFYYGVGNFSNKEASHSTTHASIRLVRGKGTSF